MLQLVVMVAVLLLMEYHQRVAAAEVPEMDSLLQTILVETVVLEVAADSMEDQEVQEHQVKEIMAPQVTLVVAEVPQQAEAEVLPQAVVIPLQQVAEV
jgi:hypothetical protein